MLQRQQYFCQESYEMILKKLIKKRKKKKKKDWLSLFPHSVVEYDLPAVRE